MMQDLTTIYEGNELSGATAGVIYLPIVRDSVLNGARVGTDSAQVGAAVFALFLNGVEIPGAGVTIANGAKFALISGLDVELADGDEAILNLVSGNVSAPISLTLFVDDGEESGASLPPGDLNAATNKLEKIQNREIFIPTDSTFSDNFNGSEIDPAKWTKSATGAAQTGGRLEFGEADAFIQSQAAKNIAGKTFIFNLEATGDGLLRLSDALLNHVFDFKYYINLVSVLRLSYNYNQNTDYPKTAAAAASAAFGRVRIVGANIFWDISADGADWTEIITREIPAGFDLTSAFIGFISVSPNWKVNDFNSNIGVSLTDKSLFWFDGSNNRFEPVTLADLKAALDALP